MKMAMLSIKCPDPGCYLTDAQRHIIVSSHIHFREAFLSSYPVPTLLFSSIIWRSYYRFPIDINYANETQ